MQMVTFNLKCRSLDCVILTLRDLLPARKRLAITQLSGGTYVLSKSFGQLELP